MRLLLIRHGQTSSNVGQHLDTAEPGADLTPLGRKQAAAIPQALEHERIDLIVVSNLVRNARIPGQPPIRVAVRGPSITVSDSGDGYPTELIDDGPQRFATYARGKGSGLGLTIADKQARAMGGRLELTNGAPELRGANATVTLQPVDAPAP